MKKGKVYLVGAGPGDPGLLTLRGREVLLAADAVLYDALIHPRILDLIPPGARRIFRGSRGRKGSLAQEGINRLLVKLAQSGKKVVRLKGGDPFVFGRGAEECLALKKARIPFEVVPGVSASVAVPAYAGIPVTHRSFNSSFTVVTGHENPAKTSPAIDWAQLSQVHGTLVFLMGLNTLPTVVSQLLAHGKDPQTPAAAIQSGTTYRQKTVAGPLKDLAALVKKAGLAPPATVVVGKTVSLREDMDWWSERPLAGLRVLVTRNQVKSGYLAGLLREEGAEVVETATIELSPLPLDGRVSNLLKGAGDYDWVVFSSANAVEFFLKAHEKLGLPMNAFKKNLIACVGPATAKAVQAAGLKPVLVPKDYKQEGLVREFRKRGMRGRKVLFIRAKEGRDVLTAYFRQAKVRCDLLALYENRVPQGARERLVELFRDQGGVDLLTFASSSAVDHFYGLFTQAQRRKWLLHLPAAVIGPVTAASARKWGVKTLLQPSNYTLPALVDAAKKWRINFKAKRL